MKKSILALAVVLGATSSFAQDLTSKKGENYLPEAGDWAIGIDASPMLNYVGNLFGKTADNNYGNGIWAFTNPNMVITGKYFVEDGLAYRAGINIGFMTRTDRALTQDLTPTATADDMVEDMRKMSSNMILLTGGMEWRKGSTRLQGFYGAELGLGFGGGSKTTYEYGNAYDVPNGITSLTNAVDGLNADVTEIVDKGGVMIGLRGFIGAEYFILPKLALGGEFGWGLGFQTFGEMTTTSQRLNAAGTAMEENTVTDRSKASAFNLGTSNGKGIWGPAARLNLTFHF